jgi:hypothetical protein
MRRRITSAAFDDYTIFTKDFFFPPLDDVTAGIIELAPASVCVSQLFVCAKTFPIQNILNPEKKEKFS